MFVLEITSVFVDWGFGEFVLGRDLIAFLVCIKNNELVVCLQSWNMFFSSFHVKMKAVSIEVKTVENFFFC